MKKTWKSLLVIVSMFVFVFLSQGVVEAGEIAQLTNTIEVGGKAVIKAKPTVAYTYATVKTENKDAKLSQEENSKLINQMKKEIKEKYKLTDEDIKTSSYNVRPSYDYVEGKQIFRAYITEHTLDITVNNIAKVGEIVDTLVEKGATSINNIRFDILDSDETYNLALQKAVANAQSKADAITTMLGVKKAKPISIIEDSNSRGVVVRDISQMAQEDSMMLGATSIEQNEIEVTASLVVTFQY